MTLFSKITSFKPEKLNADGALIGYINRPITHNRNFALTRNIHKENTLLHPLETHSAKTEVTDLDVCPNTMTNFSKHDTTFLNDMDSTDSHPHQNMESQMARQVTRPVLIPQPGTEAKIRARQTATKKEILKRRNPAPLPAAEFTEARHTSKLPSELAKDNLDGFNKRMLTSNSGNFQNYSEHTKPFAISIPKKQGLNRARTKRYNLLKNKKLNDDECKALEKEFYATRKAGIVRVRYLSWQVDRFVPEYTPNGPVQSYTGEHRCYYCSSELYKQASKCGCTYFICKNIRCNKLTYSYQDLPPTFTCIHLHKRAPTFIREQCPCTGDMDHQCFEEFIGKTSVIQDLYIHSQRHKSRVKTCPTCIRLSLRTMDMQSKMFLKKVAPRDLELAKYMETEIPSPSGLVPLKEYLETAPFKYEDDDTIPDFELQGGYASRTAHECGESFAEGMVDKAKQTFEEAKNSAKQTASDVADKARYIRDYTLNVVKDSPYRVGRWFASLKPTHWTRLVVLLYDICTDTREFSLFTMCAYLARIADTFPLGKDVKHLLAHSFPDLKSFMSLDDETPERTTEDFDVGVKVTDRKQIAYITFNRDIDNFILPTYDAFHSTATDMNPAPGARIFHYIQSKTKTKLIDNGIHTFLNTHVKIPFSDITSGRISISETPILGKPQALLERRCIHITSDSMAFTMQSGDLIFKLLELFGKMMPALDWRAMATKLSVINNLFNITKSVKTFVSAIVDFFPALKELLLAKNGDDWYAAELKNKNSAPSLFNTHGSTLYNCLTAQEVPADFVLREFTASYFTMMEVHAKRRFSPKLLNEIQRIYKEIKEAPFLTRGRALETIWFSFAGKPGVGKSSMVRKLISLAYSTNKPDDLIYNKPRGTEFFDGYISPKFERDDEGVVVGATGSVVLAIDDFRFQNSPSEPDADAIVAMQVVSNNRFTVPQAAIPDKGQQFGSEVLITTANDNTSHDLSTIRHQDAYERRQKWSVNVETTGVTPNYQTFDHLRFILTKHCGKKIKVSDVPKHTRKQLRGEREYVLDMKGMALLVREEVFNRRAETAKREVFENVDELGDLMSLVQKREEYHDVPDTKDQSVSLVADEEDQPEIILQSNSVIEQFATRVYLPALEFARKYFLRGILSLAFVGFGIYAVASIAQLTSCLGLIRTFILGDIQAEELSHLVLEQQSMETSTAKSKRIPVIPQSNLQADEVIAENMVHFARIDGPITEHQCGFLNGYSLYVPAHCVGNDETLLGYITQYKRGKATKVEFELERSRISYPDARSICTLHKSPHPHCKTCIHAANVLAVVDLRGTTLNPARVRTNMFYSSSEFTKRAPFNTRLIKNTDSGTVIREGRTEPFYNMVSDETGTNTVLVAYKTFMTTQKGDCGSLLMDAHGKIIGMHFGFSQGYAFSRPLFKELIKGPTEAPLEIEHDPEGDVKFYFQHNPIGTYTGPPIHSSTKTTLVESELYDKIHGYSPTHQKPLLSENDPRIPEGVSLMRNCMEKHAKPVVAWSQKLIQDATSVLDFKRQITPDFVEPNFLSEDEVVNGTEDIKPIDMTTSCGFGYKTSSRGKRSLATETDGKWVFTDEAFRAKKDRLETFTRKSIIIPPIVIVSKKDELASQSKIDKLKARLFYIFPVEYNVLHHQYLGSYIENYIQQKDCRDFQCVGINPYSEEWTGLVNDLLDKSDTGFSGDYSNFDGCLPVELLWVAYKTIANWYGYDHDERMTIALQIMRPIMLFDNNLVQLRSGNTSGNVATTVVNSLCNVALLYIAWNALASPEYRGPKQFHECVAVKVFGDDNIVAPIKEVQHFYNFATVQKVFANLGIKYTPADKSEDVYTVRPITELSFLKNNIGKNGIWYLALLDEESILRMTQFIRKCDDHTKATQDNANAALRFSYFYGPIYFNEFRLRLQEALPTLQLIDYNYCNELYNSIGGFITNWNPYRQRVQSSKAKQLQYDDSNTMQPKFEFQSNAQPTNSTGTTDGKMSQVDTLLSSIIPPILGTNGLGEAIGSLLDKPSIGHTERHKATAIKSFPNLSMTRGPDRSTPLTSTGAQRCIDRDVMKSGNNDSLKRLREIPIILDKAAVVWQKIQEPGEIIYAVDMTPTPTMMRTPAGDPIAPTLLEATTVPFQSWSGDLKYTIDIVSSDKHRGALLVGAGYGIYEDDDIPTSFQEASKGYYTVIELNGARTRVEFTVPYKSQYRDSFVYNGIARERCSLGMLFVQVLKPLTAPDVVSKEIELIFRLSAGENYRTHHINAHNASISYDVEEPDMGFQLQSSEGPETELAMLTSPGTNLLSDGAPEGVTTNIDPQDKFPTSTNYSVSERSWDLAKVFNKSYIIDNLEWKTTQLANEVIGSYAFPEVVFKNADFHCIQSRFAYSSFKGINISAKLNGTAYQSGLLALAWNPLMAADVAHDHLGDRRQVDIKHHILLRPHTKNDGSMWIPYNFIAEVLNHGLNQATGSLTVSVYSPLRQGSGNESCNITLHAELVGFEAFGLQSKPATKAPILELQSGQGAGSVNLASADTATGELISTDLSKNTLDMPSMNTNTTASNEVHRGDERKQGSPVDITAHALPTNKSHNFDNVDSITALCKKYMPVLSATIEQDQIFSVSMTQLLNHSHFFKLFYSIHRVSLGSMRVLIVPTTKTPEFGTILSATYAPAVDGTGGTESDALNSALISFNGFSSAVTQAPMAFNSNGEMLEFEVPFTGITNYKLNGPVPKRFGTEHATLLLAASRRLDVNIYMAVGDDYSFGLPYAVPDLRIHPQQIPDHWPATVVNEKSEDEFVKLTKSQYNKLAK